MAPPVSPQRGRRDMGVTNGNDGERIEDASGCQRFISALQAAKQ